MKTIIKDGIKEKWCFTQWWLVIYDYIRHPSYHDYPFAYTDDISPNVEFSQLDYKKIVKQFVVLNENGVIGNNKQWVWLIR